MRCKSAGCYAVTFSRGLCRNHFYMWREQLPTASSDTKGELRATSTPPPKMDGRKPGYIGPCRCDQPNPQHIAWFNCYQCGNCGMPLELSA